MQWHKVIEPDTGMTVSVWAAKHQNLADLQWMARIQIVSAALKLEAKYGAEKLHIKTTRQMTCQPVPGSP